MTADPVRPWYAGPPFGEPPPGFPGGVSAVGCRDCDRRGHLCPLHQEERTEVMPTDDSVERVVLRVLAEKWDEWPTTVRRTGPRVFVRWIRSEGADDEIGWNDWTLSGTVAGDAVTWLDADPDPGVVGPIEAAIRGGECCGKFDPEAWLTLWWCRSDLDGPPDDRTTDLLGTTRG